MEQRLDRMIHVAAGAGPDRDRQQHDVHGRKTGDAEAAGQVGIAVLGGAASVA